MDSKSTKQIARILRIHPGRIEQWISRNQFLPQIFAEKGLGRDWDFSEALRLSLFVHLVDIVGMAPRTAGILTQTGVHGFVDDCAFFVAYRGRPGLSCNWGRHCVRERDLGHFLTEGCDYPKVLQAGDDPATIEENSKPNLGPAHVAVIVNLDEIEADLRDAWKD